MAIQLNNSGVVNVPNIILKTRGLENICHINNFFDLNYTENFNSANELSFSIYKEDNAENWNNISDHKIIYVPEYKENFEITISMVDEDSTRKSISATSLCESELSQTLLRNIEINTENDIARENYQNVWDNYDVNFPTVLYRDWKHPEKYDWSDRNGMYYSRYTIKEKQMVLFYSSLLHRLLEKTPHYSIDFVQESLWNVQRTFSFSDTDIYSALNEVAEEIGCIFKYDSLRRNISVYDLYSTCSNCGYRGDYSDICPECGSNDVYGQYGEDTTILVDKENLAKTITLESKADSLKNTFYIEGGDDVINAAIRTCNPNGSQYIVYCSDEILSDMSDELSEKILEYNKDYETYYMTKRYGLDSDFVSKYNSVVSYVKNNFSNDSSIISKFNLLPVYTLNGLYYSYLEGYKEVAKYIYEAIDLYYFINTSMMPTIDIGGMNIDESIDNIRNGFSNGLYTLDSDGNRVQSGLFQNAIAVSSPHSAIKSTVDNVVKNTAKLFCSTAYYDIDADGTYTYNSSASTGVWNGIIKITSLTETDENTGNKISRNLTLTLNVNNNIDLFISQTICYSTYDKDKLEFTQILGLDMTDDTFKQQLNLYSLDELNLMLQKFEGCLGVINNLSEQSSKFIEEDGKNLIKKYYSFYSSRMKYITNELLTRQQQIDYIANIYTTESNEGLLNQIQYNVQSYLDFENYVGEDLFKEFCSYRREQIYSNSNYISDGLTDSEIIEKANSLIETAKKELYKAGNLQWTLTATINNLIIMDEFKPLWNKFCVGNWIRVRIEDKLYKLRLLSYNVTYDNLESISVEFSTVEKIYGSVSDVNSVLDSISSLTSSYSYIEKQAEKSDSMSSMYRDWVNDGLNATLIKYVNADNQTLIIDSNGLLARAWDFETNDYSKYQLKIVNNGLYTTHDNWQSIDTGIGRINYFDPITGEYVDDYGVIARTLVGHLILGENLVIANCNDKNKSTVVIDADGITLDGGSIKWINRLGLSDLDEATQKEIAEAEANIKKNANAISQEITDRKNSIAKEEEARKKAYNDMDASVAHYLGLGAGTLVGDSYVISPYIGGGYLAIVNEQNGAKVVIDPAAKKTDTTNGDLISATYNDKKIFYINSTGKAYFNGEIIATSIKLNGCKIDTGSISGLSDYATVSSVDEKLKSYATTGNLSEYLKTNDLQAKLGDLKVAYSGDVTTSQTKDSATGLITTTNTYKDSSGITHSYTTYTYEDSNYVLLNRENKWGNGSTVGDGQNLVKISKDGLLQANNAIIYGTIYATNGEFNGKITSSIGKISCWDINNSGIYRSETINDGIYNTWSFPLYTDGKAVGTSTASFDVKTLLGQTLDGTYGLETQGYDNIGRISIRLVSGGLGFYRMYNSFTINDTNGEFTEANHKINNTYSSCMSIYTTPMSYLKYLGKGIMFDGSGGDSISFWFNGDSFIILNKNIPTYAKNFYGLHDKTNPSVIINKNLECLNNVDIHGSLYSGKIISKALTLQLYDNNTLEKEFTFEPYWEVYNGVKFYTLKLNTLLNAQAVFGDTKVSLGNFTDTADRTLCMTYNGTGVSKYGRIGVVETAKSTIGNGIKWNVEGQMTIDSYTSSSDERLKKDFDTLDKIDNVFMELEPVSFRYRYNDDNNIHIGFKAQDVKNALNKNGLSEDDYAMFESIPKLHDVEELKDSDTEYQISYQEFTAWNTHMIQKCITENENLKQRIKKLEALLGNS